MKLTKKIMVFLDRALRIRYVPFYKAYWLGRRKGSCNGCAKCCWRSNNVPCDYLQANNKCLIYNEVWRKPPVCGEPYPINPFHLWESGLDVKDCSYTWEAKA